MAWYATLVYFRLQMAASPSNENGAMATAVGSAMLRVETSARSLSIIE